MWYLHCELRELSRVRESLVAVAEGDFSFVFTVRGSHGHRREGETISESNSVSILKGSLQKVAEEESSLRSLVESLKLEIENVKKEHFELKEKEAGSWKQK
ncbi:hypothetical protein ACOSP7_031252 [Xanthoceras sorbifolium]